MSELVNVGAMQGNFRKQLLTSVSTLALLASVYGTREARADDSDHPIVWVEVGGAFDQISAGETGWSPPNMTPPISNPKPLPFGKLPAIGFDTDLKLSFTPENSDWIYSASIRYGRAKFGPKDSHDQTHSFHGYSFDGSYKYFPNNYDFTDTARQSHSTHAILDFMAGRDFGLGFFGGKSTVSFGVRIAQLNENTQGQLTAFTNAQPQHYPPVSEIGHIAELVASRSFNGLGPSISWDESAPFAGSLSNGFSIDWGANAALLFGRQKANVSLHTKDTQYPPGAYGVSGVPVVLAHSTQPFLRNKTVVVPNVGGFAGLSWRLPDVKVSLGYRADFFFSAIDGGLMTSQKETRGFYGPFANISIGIGG
jgi:hypothetical protein